MAQIKFVSIDKLLYFKQKITGLLDKKVDKVLGKQLSTNDYTTEEKNKLAGLNNYTLPTASSTVKGGVKVGAGLAVTEDGILSATGGGTADAVEWENVIGKPTKVSQFTNDKKYQTDVEVEATINKKGFLTSVPAEYVTETELTEKGYQTANQVTTAITSKGYQTSSQVQSNKKGFLTSVPAEYVTETELTEKGYQTANQVTTAITSKGYQTSSQVQSAKKGFLTSVPAEYVTETELTEKGYQTANQVTTAITSKGYQTSSQVQSAINSALSGITGIDFQVVSELPVSGKKGVIYLIKHSHGAQDIYDEYIWVTDKFEKIGNTDIDLSGYWKKTDLTECTNGDIDAIFA